MKTISVLTDKVQHEKERKLQEKKEWEESMQYRSNNLTESQRTNQEPVFIKSKSSNEGMDE